jgi:carboxymethylenebutenolidase
MGFCFGGGMVWRLLNGAPTELAAAVPFYGPARRADLSGSKAAVLAIYAELDNRVNATQDVAIANLEASELEHDVLTFGGVDHGFFNDTVPRYDEASANDAWQATLSWIRDHT